MQGCQYDNMSGPENYLKLLNLYTQKIKHTCMPGEVHVHVYMSHWGLYIIRVNHSLKGTLNEDEPRVRTKLAPGYSSQISYPFRGS